MLPARFVPGQSSAMRKSRLGGDGKPSLLPKPRRPGSTDRLSTEARRPSTTGLRSSSAEPRGTFGAGRLSREASASKAPLNGRSRSQTGERYGQVSMTPLRTSNYLKPTTPVRTPSEDRSTRSWQTSLDRALAFVTVKDQRAISSVAWQRAEVSRVGSALAARAGGAGGALLRPLTIARFVTLAADLLANLARDFKINNDSYVAKLPHICKRLLYPGTVSKSWLKTVNTLHAFPHALALLAYLLDLVTHIEAPVSDEWLYVEKDELASLRREYLYKCWIRFQDPGHQFEDLNDEYLESLKEILGNDEEKIVELQNVIQKYESCLSDPEEVSARAHEARCVSRRDALLQALRAEKLSRTHVRADTAARVAENADMTEMVRAVDAEIERATAESAGLKAMLESQEMSVSERARLLDELDYSSRVLDSKRALADQISKMVLSKETELAMWQKKTLDSCLQYKQGLIHLSAQFPELAGLAIDEKELMASECGAAMVRAADTLRARHAALADTRALAARQRGARARRRAQLLDEAHAKITSLKSVLARSQEALEAETASEVSAALGWARSRAARDAELQALRARAAACRLPDVDVWEKQYATWKSKLSELQQYIELQKSESRRLLEQASRKRVALLAEHVRLMNKHVEA